MNNKLLTSLLACAMIVSSSVFAMENNDEIPSSISVKKSAIISAWKGDKKLSADGRNYTLSGYIAGRFGDMFLSSGEYDESLITFASPSYPPIKGDLQYMEQRGPEIPGEEMDGIVHIQLK